MCSITRIQDLVNNSRLALCLSRHDTPLIRYTVPLAISNYSHDPQQCREAMDMWYGKACSSNNEAGSGLGKGGCHSIR
jgi:hypothetical protein